MRKTVAIWCLVILAFASSVFGADADYKQVLVFTNGNTVRARLPLTDVTGKVRVKDISPDGFGIPVASSKTLLGEKRYLEWQIGYSSSFARFSRSSSIFSKCCHSSRREAGMESTSRNVTN